MPLVKWENIYSVEIPIIDNQHKEILRLINDLHSAMSQGVERAILQDILSALISFTWYHFKEEEKLFKIYDYPYGEEHAQQHREVEEKIRAMHEQFEAGNGIIIYELMNLLASWLINHIKNSDRNYSEYLISQGIWEDIH